MADKTEEKITMKHMVLTLNNISDAGLERLPAELYEVSASMEAPDAILLRSFNMHDMEIPATLKAVCRAGAGVNNIPVDKMSGLGIPVFNAPGANANAVKELVVTGMLLAARNICPAWQYASHLEGSDEEIHKQTEAGKKTYAGFELPGRTLGVIGLGAIGIQVANVALDLGMNVVGYDPQITVQSAWQLSAQVNKAGSVEELLARSDFVSLHVPLVDETRNLLNEARIGKMKKTATLLNFARNGIVDDAAVARAVSENRIHAYVCDFPSNVLKGNERIITLPHLGASTREAEDNCAIMVAEQLRKYLEEGNIINSVNFPEVIMPKNGGSRICIANSNVPAMLGQISTALANAGLNIIDMLNKSRGDIAYTLVDVESAIPDATVTEIHDIEGVLSVRVI